MKKTILFALAITLLTSVSCKKSSTNPGGGGGTATVSGKWNLVNTRLLEKVDGITDNDKTVPFLTGEWYEFASGNVFNKRTWQDDGAGGGQFAEAAGTYQLDGSKLKINDAVFDIKTLTTTGLTLYQKDEQTVDGITYSSEIWLNLKR